MKKRLLAALLAATCLFAGCANNGTGSTASDSSAADSTVSDESTAADDSTASEDNSTSANNDVKVGFVYIGKIDDGGYTQAHDAGRLAIEEMGVPTAYVEEDYAFEIAKGNTELYNQVNGALEELLKDGTIQAIIAKYIAAD